MTTNSSKNGETENNRFEHSTIVDIIPIPYADLEIELGEITQPLTSDTPIEIEWTVTNLPSALSQTSIGQWTDRIYLAPGAIVPMTMTPIDGGVDQVAIGAFQQVVLWNPSNERLTTLGSHSASIRAVASLDNGVLVSADYGGTVRAWNPNNGYSRSARSHYREVTSITPLDDGRFVTTGMDGRLILWNSTLDSNGRTSISRLSTITELSAGIHDAISLSNTRIAIVGQDATVSIFDVYSKNVQTMRDHGWSVRSLDLLPDGRIVSGDASGRIIVWDPVSEDRQILFSHSGAVNSIKSLDDGTFVSASYDGTVLLWDLTQDEPLTVARHTSRILSMDVLTDGRIASTDEDGNILISTPGETVDDPVGEHTGPVVSAFALADGRLISGSEDGTLRIWNPIGSQQSRIVDYSRAYGTDGNERAFEPHAAHPLEAFNHIGFLGVGDSYERRDTDTLAAGIEGRFYAVGKTGNPSSSLNVDPFEFTFKSNNVDLSDPFVIELAANPDLRVVDITAPKSAEEGSIFDVSWTVSNVGNATAHGSWTEKVYLQEAGNSNARLILAGTFQHAEPLEAGKRYSRQETISVPFNPSDLYKVIVRVNEDTKVYEGGRQLNNSLTDDDTIAISIKPRADLRVVQIQAPEQISPTDALTVAYQIGNFGGGSTINSITAPTWKDRVYLSLDTRISSGDVLLGTFDHPSALEPGELGTVITVPATETIPLRFRGTVYVLVATDATDVVSEWPNNGNNVSYQPIYVVPEPLPDLVVENVITWDESVELADATEHAVIEVQYSVNNRGFGEAQSQNWVETVWLTNTQHRPHPGQGDFKLEIISEVDADDNVLQSFSSGTKEIGNAKTFLDPDNDGLIDRDAGYTRRLKVRLPDLLESGVYYITPWIDPYDQVAEDSLAINVNPYDPNQIDSSNYRSTPITTIAARPDLRVTAVDVEGKKPDGSEISAGDAIAGGDTISVTWTVENHGNGAARPGGWTDSIYLSPIPNPVSDADFKNSLLLGAVRSSEDGLSPYAPDLDPETYNYSYTRTLETTLAPSAKGQYIVVRTNSSPRPNAYGFNDLLFDAVWRFTEQVVGKENLEQALAIHGVEDPRYTSTNTIHLDELTESNNIRAVAQTVDPQLANLRVIGSEIVSGDVYSGGQVTFRYTVRNDSDFPVWRGTEYWKDHIWISADESFETYRSTFLGTNVTSHAPYIGAHQEYTTEFTALLPEGLDGGDYNLWVHLDAHRNYSIYRPPIVNTSWLPKDRGSNESIKKYFKAWAYEDPSDNVTAIPIDVIYREADLVIANVQHSPSVDSGESVSVTYRVENQGERDTRQSKWPDRIFLSRDSSLDKHDLLVWQGNHTGVLAAGDSYTNTVSVPMLDAVDGDFHLLVYTDSPAHRANPYRGIYSNIGYGELGLEFAAQGTAKTNDDERWDYVSTRSRNLAKGEIAEYLFEGNNLSSTALTINPWVPTDLQVDEVVIPTHVGYGERLEVSYTVSNQGGDTTGSDAQWYDNIYLSRDEYLDTSADRYLGRFRHSGGLAAGGNYSRRIEVYVPIDMLGAYYVFVVTDPASAGGRGQVIEGDFERNNATAGPEQVVIDVPPPTDLEVIEVSVPLHGPDGPDSALLSGDAFSFSWTVANLGGRNTSGFWSDAVYLSADELWDVNDVLIDVVGHEGALKPGDAYTRSLTANMPPVLDGNYRIIVRTDIFNQVWEDEFDANNNTTSDDAMVVAVPELPIDGFLDTTISTGHERLYRISGVADDETMRISLDSDDPSAQHELFVRHEAAPTGYANDEFAYRGGVNANQEAIVPLTEPGNYYVLVRGFSNPRPEHACSFVGRILVAGCHQHSHRCRRCREICYGHDRRRSFSNDG